MGVDTNWKFNLEFRVEFYLDRDDYDNDRLAMFRECSGSIELLAMLNNLAKKDWLLSIQIHEFGRPYFEEVHSGTVEECFEDYWCTA